MSKTVWSSQSIRLTPESCVDVKADAVGVVLRQVGVVIFEDIHLTAEQACQVADALTQGAAKCLEARGNA